MPTVLVVDDEPDIRELLRINLESAGYDVLIARDGDEALQAVAARHPDAIFLDVLMPGTDGWSVLERIKASDGGLANVPVLMVTALTRTEDRLRGAIEGAVRYLTKPFDPCELLTALDEVLAPGGPAEPEQRRLARQAALETLARIEAHGGENKVVASDGPRVHLTRLERGPARTLPSTRGNDARCRLVMLTPKQRDLLDVVASEGGVAAAAVRLDTSRSNVYASLRRIVHRLRLRDTTELLRLVYSGELLGPQSP